MSILWRWCLFLVSLLTIASLHLMYKNLNWIMQIVILSIPLHSSGLCSSAFRQCSTATWSHWELSYAQVIKQITLQAAHRHSETRVSALSNSAWEKSFYWRGAKENWISAFSYSCQGRSFIKVWQLWICITHLLLMWMSVCIICAPSLVSGMTWPLRSPLPWERESETTMLPSRLLAQPSGPLRLKTNKLCLPELSVPVACLPSGSGDRCD